VSGDRERAISALEGISQSLPTPWSAAGESPAQYMERLTQKARAALEVLKTGDGDVQLARDVIVDTIQLATYAAARKELECARAVIQSVIAKGTQHGAVNTKRSDQRD